MTRRAHASLYGALNRTVTPMGARRLRDWLSPAAGGRRRRFPGGRMRCRLCWRTAGRWMNSARELAAGARSGTDAGPVERRQRQRARSVVAAPGAGANSRAERLSAQLAPRPPEPACGTCASAAAGGSAGAGSRQPGLLDDLDAQLAEAPDLVELIGRAIVDEPPLALKEGGLIRDGFDSALDELRAAPCAAARIGSPNCSRTKSSAPASLAQGAVQLRFRLLHRGDEIQPGQGAAAVYPQTDHCQRRAVYHAGIEGDGGQNPGRGGAQREAGIRIVPAGARGGAGTVAGLATDGGGAGATGRAGGVRRNGAAVQLLPPGNRRRRACWKSATAGIRCWNRLDEERFVPNDALRSTAPAAPQSLLITGPNMAGKSTSSGRWR